MTWVAISVRFLYHQSNSVIKILSGYKWFIFLTKMQFQYELKKQLGLLYTYIIIFDLVFFRFIGLFGNLKKLL